jgi:hypothetical protein
MFAMPVCFSAPLSTTRCTTFAPNTPLVGLLSNAKQKMHFHDENTTLSGSRELDQPICTVR